MKELIDKIASMTKCSMTIGLNEPKAFYSTIRAELEQTKMYDSVIEGTDLDGDIWEVRVYSRTPVAFYLLFGNDLEEILRRMIEILEEEQ